MAHEASDLSDRIREPQRITSYAQMNDVTVQKLNQTGALPLRDVKEYFCSTQPAQVKRCALAVPFKREVDQLKGT